MSWPPATITSIRAGTSHPTPTSSTAGRCTASPKPRGPTCTRIWHTERIEAVFDKGRYEAAYSGFQGSSDGVSLLDWLRAHEVERVEIVGIATDHCVRATALDAAANGFATTIDLELTAGVAAASVAVALEQLRSAGVTLIGEPLVLG